MANILADAYNKAMNEEGEKIDKQQSEAPEVDPSPNNVETDKTVKVKALGEAKAEVGVEALVAAGPEVNLTTSPNNVEGTRRGEGRGGGRGTGSGRARNQSNDKLQRC
jgi:hypothetical protein